MITDSKIVISADNILAKAKIYPDCLICQGQRFILKFDKFNRSLAMPCKCNQLNTRANMYNQAHIPSQYWDSTLKNTLKVGLPKIESAIKKSKDLIINYKKNEFNKGLLYYGNPGTGKTRLACATIREFILSYGIEARFIEFVQLLNNIKRGYDTNKPESEFLLPVVEVDILVIDELGKGRKSEWEGSILDQIVSMRYFARKTTIFTTNYIIDNTNDHNYDIDDKLLVNRIDQRIYSRLCEMTNFVDMNTKDFRDEPTIAKEM